MQGSTLKKIRPQRAFGLAGALKLLLLLAGLGLALFLLMAPGLIGFYWVRVLTQMLMFATIAQGINIMAGYTGCPVFGNVVFFGIGAYGTAIVMVQHGGPFALGVLVGVVAAVLFAVVLGTPLLRLRGHYFAIATLGLNEASKAIANNLQITGGGNGLSLPLPPGSVAENATFFYYLFLALAVIGVAIVYALNASRLGYACRAIRANEDTAACSGIDTTRVKTLVWCISAALTAVAGGFYAYWMSYVEPLAVFDMTIAVKAFVIFLIGGVATPFGPIAGAAVVELLTTFAWSNLLDWHVGFLGLILILVVLVIPDGLVRTVSDRLLARPAATDEER